MADNVETVVLTRLELDTSQAVKASEDLEKQQDKTADATEKATEETADYNSALDSLLSSMGILPASMQKGLKGTTNLTKGFKGLKAAIIATGIGALIVALGALYTWFNRSSEGQEKLRIGMAVIGQVVSVLLDGFADLGEMIFNTFTDPKKAIADLWEFIKTNIVNRVLGLGQLFSGLKNTIEAAFTPGMKVKDGLKEMGEAVLMITTGFDVEQVETFYNKIIDKGKEAGETIRASIALQDRANELEREQIAFLTVEAEIRRDIANARLRANQAGLGTNQQLEASNEALVLTNELFDERIRLQQESTDILAAQQALGLNTIEDNREMQAELAKIIELEKQRDDALRSITTKNETLIKQIVKQREEETGLSVDIQNRFDMEVAANQLKNDEISLSNLEARKLENEAYLEDSEQRQEIDQAEADAKIELELAVFGQIANILSNAAADNKAAGISSVLISTAIAIIKAFELGPIVGAISAISIGILSAKQINDIRKASRGAMIRGRSHGFGGELIEAEGGEAIVNKRTMSDPYLSGIVSAANVAGGGIPLAQNGMLIGEAQQMSALNNMSRDVQRVLANNPPVMILEDFHRTNNRVRIKNEIRTF